jgi:transposase
VSEHENLRRDVELMTSVPGVGFKTAVLLLAECGDLRGCRARRTGQLRRPLPASLRIGPKRASPASPGGRRRQAHSQRGFWLPACRQKRCACAVADFGRHLEAVGKSKMSAIGAMMRKLLLVLRAIVRSGKPYDPNFKKATAGA